MAIDPLDLDTIDQLPAPVATVIQDNELVTARYVNQLRLQDRRLLYLALSKLDQTKSRYEWEDRFVQIHAKEFAEVFGITHHDFYEGLADACRRLWQTDVCVAEDGPNKKYVRVFEAIGYIKNQGFIELCFTQSIMYYLTTFSQQYTLCQLRQLAKMSSTHAMSLYQFCRMFHNTGWAKITVENFRSMTGIEDTKYTAFADLRTKVLEPAIKQINAATDLDLKFQPIKKGRTIEMLYFTFQKQTH